MTSSLANASGYYSLGTSEMRNFKTYASGCDGNVTIKAAVAGPARTESAERALESQGGSPWGSILHADFRETLLGPDPAVENATKVAWLAFLVT